MHLYVGFLIFAFPVRTRKHLNIFCLFLFKTTTTTTENPTNCQSLNKLASKRKSSLFPEQQMLSLTLGFKGKSILVYMS